MRASEMNRLPWRVGRKLGRTVYVQLGAEASDDDPVIGMLDNAAIAAEAVTAHNLRLELRKRGILGA